MAEPAASPPVASPAGAEPSADTLFADVRNLVGDVQTAAEAELHFQKARAGYVVGEAKGIALWSVLAISALVLALFALATGVLLGLIPVVGPWGATAIVVGALLLLAALAGWRAAAGAKRVKRIAAPGDGG